MRCVDLYNQAQSKWFEEMVTTTLVRNSLEYLTQRTLHDCNCLQHSSLTAVQSSEKNGVINLPLYFLFSVLRKTPVVRGRRK